MRPPKGAFIAPREESRTLNDAVSRVSGTLGTRLTSRAAMKAPFGGNVTLTPGFIFLSLSFCLPALAVQEKDVDRKRAAERSQRGTPAAQGNQNQNDKMMEEVRKHTDRLTR